MDVRLTLVTASQESMTASQEILTASREVVTASQAIREELGEVAMILFLRVRPVEKSGRHRRSKTNWRMRRPANKLR